MRSALRYRLQEKAGVKISRATTQENHPKAKSNPQKKTTHASEQYTERVQKLRAEYWTTIGSVNLADLVFIDEVGVNIAMTRHFARMSKGSREDWRSPLAELYPSRISRSVNCIY